MGWTPGGAERFLAWPRPLEAPRPQEGLKNWVVLS
jgi:hypothetical protein